MQRKARRREIGEGKKAPEGKRSGRPFDHVPRAALLTFLLSSPEPSLSAAVKIATARSSRRLIRASVAVAIVRQRVGREALEKVGYALLCLNANKMVVLGKD